MDKKLFLVFGPESSGNHLTSLVLKTMGAYWEEPQKLDQFLDGKLKIEDITSNTKIVLRRSVPHGREWPSWNFIKDSFVDKGYEVKTIILRREWISTVFSNYYHRCNTIEEAWDKLVKAEKHIARYIQVMDDFYMLSTSSLMKDPRPVIKGLEIYTGLKWPDGIDPETVVFDADYSKHSLLLEKGFMTMDRSVVQKYTRRNKIKKR